ncbi:hypothetical protein MRB53_001853 [Persea americana]|uniref:Uncharacterized protein n=1 Tax=Persea americana TaxID=3435 RepID=A0ACC2MTT7_PERAE|nr:hypothetical protein MRB53_001853 [Persea americana]
MFLPFCKPNLVSMPWQPNTTISARHPTPPIPRPSKLPPSPKPTSSSPPLKSQAPESNPQSISTKHTTQLVETFHQNQKLRTLLQKIQRKGSDPLQLLREEGDWTKEQFWAVMRLLKETSRMQQALQVFDFWKSIEKSRISEVNYMKFIEWLSKSGLMEEAVSMLQEMKMHGLSPPVEVYNSIIHGFAQKGEFDSARLFLKEMVEKGIIPDPETYDGLIQAYGSYRMYDEMCKCMKKMESEGCSPDHVTYNILIRAFARGGLLEKMEGVHRTLLSKKMALQSLTLVAMLEAYVSFGIVEKMEKVYHKILNSELRLKEGLVRKMARVYIENHMFSRLEELGLKTASKTERTYLLWCLLLLSNACLLSRKGMESVIREMEAAKVRPHVTYVNTMALAYLKMKDFRHLDMLLRQLRSQNVKPDLITVGIIFDAYVSRLERTEALDAWRGIGFLKEEVQMNTDPLVLTAFGKGSFVRSCEDLYSSLGSKGREKKVWTYNDLIDLVFKNGRKASFEVVNRDSRPCNT